MNEFTHTKLQDGEKVVLGIMTFSSSGGFSLRFGNASGGGSATRTRKVGVTNRRVIVEQVGSPEQTQIVANADVRRVHLKHDKFGAKIEKIETTRNQTLKLDLGGLHPIEESRLNELFPNAEIKGQKHGPGTVVAPPKPVKAPARRPAKSAGKSAPKPPAPPVSDVFAAIAQGKSHISDPDIESLDDLKRYYPLPKGYVYQQTEDGFVVVRSKDEAKFGFLLEDGMLGFDIPAPGKPGNKRTIEVIKKG
ncbi:MAG: hypothetical protein KKA73_25370 [Chloroflexi bacterium]|nr:hypothetical protein [Chloroflexota bacterium]MBU1751027.1 hypothetical protein [Chloroflexota bacterium]MBU1878935.1 hypothetical protein [Chloroflexota bacterium]